MINKKFGTIRILSSGRAHARYRLPSGEQVSAGTFGTQEEAQGRLDEIEIDLRRGVHWDERKAKTKFRDFMVEYMRHREKTVSAGELNNNQSYLKVHLLPAFGHLRMEQIDEEFVDHWFAAQPATETRRNVYAFLRRSMKFAVKWKYLRTSPCNVLDQTKGLSKPRPTFTMADFCAVLNHVPSEIYLNQSKKPTRVYYREALELLLATHARLGELVALNANDVDRKSGTVTIDKQITALGHLTDTKTGQHGSVTLLSTGRKALEALPKGIGAAPLLPGVRTARLSRRTLQRAWRKAALEAGLGDFRVHDLRHVGLTIIASSGATEHDVASRARHASTTSTRRYMHRDADRDRTIVALADALLEATE